MTALKHAGEATADQLAAGLGVTVSAVRQQLDALAADGLVAWRPEPAGQGRPTHLYRLTRAAEPPLPQGLRRAHHRAAGLRGRHRPGPGRRHLRPPAPASPRRRPRPPGRRRARPRLPGGRAGPHPRRGRLPGLPARPWPTGPFRIVEHNCAVARRGRTLRPGLLQRDRLPAPGPARRRVERVSHMIAGAHSCAYQIDVAAARRSQAANCSQNERGRRTPSSVTMAVMRVAG
ncbi:MAG: ArsR family transcriptional regulator [Hymenobacter sp.]